VEDTVGQPGEIQKLQDGLTTLGGAGAGHSITAAIREHGATVRFGQTEEDAIAYFDPVSNEIVVNEELGDTSLSILVQHLAHEGAHVQWNRPNSIDQEYHAFKAEAEVWNQLKGDEADRQCDRVSGMTSKGEVEAKRKIRWLYPGLPEYA
jgi:hypothetical protein